MIPKRFISFLTVFCLLIPLSVSAESVPCYSWYTVPTKDGKQPTSFEAQNILNRHSVIYLGKPDEKVIYLTFDAGYENGNVAKVVETLDKHGIKGAFFVLPHFIRQNAELVSKMAESGHLICNHSTTHRDMSSVSDFAEFEKELSGVADTFHEITGKNMAKFYRPPEGKFSEENLEFAEKLGYTTVFWSLAYADWDNNRQPSPDKAKALILSRVHNGCVMLLHPTSSTNAAILDDLINEFTKEGYCFGTLDEFCA